MTTRTCASVTDSCKTRYLISLGRKLKDFPKIREALKSGKIGWCKASRIAQVATLENESMWLDSALSSTVQDLENRIKDGTDSLASTLHLYLSEERRILWENALEITRRRAGAEISPVEAFELIMAEVLAEWAHLVQRDEPENQEAEVEISEATDAEADATAAAAETDTPFPFAEPIGADLDTSDLSPRTESTIEQARDATYDEIRSRVLERDGWKCTYPGCQVRARLHVHHVEFRSRGGGHDPWNLTVVCEFHHGLLHREQIQVTGRAPFELQWSPPKLMRAVLERRRNRPNLWLGELEVREWSLEPRETSPPDQRVAV